MDDRMRGSLTQLRSWGVSWTHCARTLIRWAAGNKVGPSLGWWATRGDAAG